MFSHENSGNKCQLHLQFDMIPKTKVMKVLKIPCRMLIMIADLNKFEIRIPVTTFSKRNGRKIALHKISLTKHFKARQLKHLDLLQANHR